MAQAKMSITVGPVSFSGEGDDAWLSKQLDKVLEHGPELLKNAPEPLGGNGSSSEEETQGGGKKVVGNKTLASFLKEKGAATNQNKRFLATAVWLHDRGQKRLTTRDVSKALSDNSQKRLGNPSDCLNKNVAQGHCEKVGKEFYVTDEGRGSLR
jgi:hypothetical protein